MLTSMFTAAFSGLSSYVVRGLAAWGEQQALWSESSRGDHPADDQELALRVLMTHWF